MLKYSRAMPLDPTGALLLDPAACVGAALECLPPPPPTNNPSGSGPDLYGMFNFWVQALCLWLGTC